MAEVMLVSEHEDEVEQLRAAIQEAVEWNWNGEEYHDIPKEVIWRINKALAAVDKPSINRNRPASRSRRP